MKYHVFLFVRCVSVAESHRHLVNRSVWQTVRNRRSVRSIDRDIRGIMPAKRGTEITYGCTKILNGYTFTGNRIYGNFKPLEIYGEPYARERQAVGILRATVRKI